MVEFIKNLKIMKQLSEIDNNNLKDLAYNVFTDNLLTKCTRN